FKEPAYYKEFKKFDINTVQEPEDYREVAEFLLAHPNIASKKWIYEQYDSMVGTVNMSTNKPSDAAIVNVKNANCALALKVDCNSRYVYADPHVGGAIAVSEASRNIVCSGGEGVAITNCLNFGNPYNPEVFWQFVNAIKGIGEACNKFTTPVTGGNVSFYNQSSYEGPVFPTPTIGMLGIVKDKHKTMTLDFKKEGDLIYMIGECHNDISSSEYLYSYHNVKASPAPHFNLDEEFEVQAAVKGLIAAGLVESAHDCSDGGLFVTLAESVMPRGLGFDINSDGVIRKDAFLFGEGQSRVVVSVSPDKEDAFVEYMANSSAEFSMLGVVVGKEFVVDEESLGEVSEYKGHYDNSIGEIMA
ncbi:MAG TPA: AIR synthase related protein, partial [Bacteroidia bacterium]|nr:AIR synthase related protein [Bacteroidia bacterium]